MEMKGNPFDSAVAVENASLYFTERGKLTYPLPTHDVASEPGRSVATAYIETPVPTDLEEKILHLLRDHANSFVFDDDFEASAAAGQITP